MTINRVHPRHSDQLWKGQHHYLLAFHDETFEAIAKRISGRYELGTMEALLLDASRRLIHRR